MSRDRGSVVRRRLNLSMTSSRSRLQTRTAARSSRSRLQPPTSSFYTAEILTRYSGSVTPSADGRLRPQVQLLPRQMAVSTLRFSSSYCQSHTRPQADPLPADGRQTSFSSFLAFLSARSLRKADHKNPHAVSPTADHPTRHSSFLCCLPGARSPRSHTLSAD